MPRLCTTCGRREDRLSSACPRSDIHIICMVPLDGLTGGGD